VPQERHDVDIDTTPNRKRAHVDGELRVLPPAVVAGLDFTIGSRLMVRHRDRFVE